MNKGPRDHPRSLEINREVKKEWYDAYLHGVSRFPQGFFGISTYVASALLETDIQKHLNQFSLSKLSEQQIERISRAAESHHEKRGVTLPDSQRDIPADLYTPSNEALSESWVNGSRMAQQRLYEFQGILTHGVEKDPDLVFTTKYKITENPHVLAQMKKAINAIVEVLDSLEVDIIRDEYVRGIGGSKDPTRQRNRELGLQAHAKLIPLLYEKLVQVFPEAEYPRIAQQLAELQFPNDWQATDEMLRGHDTRHG